MSNVDWSKFKCRCSSIVKLLANGSDNQQITDKQLDDLKKLQDKERTDKQEAEMNRLLALKANSGKISLGLSALEYLMEVFAWEKEQMMPVGKEALDVLQLKKGKMVEAESLELLSIVDKVQYKTHKERIYNDYLSGEVDYYAGASIYEATNVTDCKNAFDYPTFLRKINNGLENGQREQVAGYGLLTGAKTLFISNCLVSFTPEMIMDMEYKVLRKIGAATTESPEFIKEWTKFERSMTFDHMPPHQRVFKIPVEPFTENENCLWLQGLHKKLVKHLVKFPTHN